MSVASAGDSLGRSHPVRTKYEGRKTFKFRAPPRLEAGPTCCVPLHTCDLIHIPHPMPRHHVCSRLTLNREAAQVWAVISTLEPPLKPLRKGRVHGEFTET